MVKQVKTYTYITTFIICVLRAFWGSVKLSEGLSGIWHYVSIVMLGTIAVGLGILWICDLILNKKRLLVVTVTIAFFGITGFLYTDVKLALTVAFALLAADVDFNKIVKSYFWTVIISIVICEVGLVFGLSIYDETLTAGVLEKRNYGMHGNLLSGYIFSCLLAGWYLYLQKKAYIASAVGAILGIVMLNVFMCKTSALLTFFFAVIVWVIPLSEIMNIKWNRAFNNRTIRAIFVALPAINTIFCTLLMSVFFFTNALYSFRWGYMMARFGMPCRYISDYGWSLLGGAIPKEEANLQLLDCTYLNVFVLRGILVGIAIVLLLSYLMKRTWDSKQIALCLIVVMFLLMGFMETYLIRVHYAWVLVAVTADKNESTRIFFD